MQSIQQLGVWMDHSEAHLIKHGGATAAIRLVVNPFDQEEMTLAIHKGEHLMHNKRQQYLAAYYKKISDKISSYKAIILFGPTDAKYELLNLLKKDTRFWGIKTAVHTTDKMTENQKRAFVEDYFS